MMRVLLVDAFPAGDLIGEQLVAAARHTLERRGHHLTVSRLDTDRFAPFMTAAERAAYHGDEPLQADDTRREAAAVRDAEGLLFCYPTVTGTVPAPLKGWLERVLVPGVAFGFSASGRVTRGLTNVVRLGAVTSVSESRWRRLRRRDGGRRTLLQTLRLNCATTCRRTWVPVHGADTAAVSRALGRW